MRRELALCGICGRQLADPDDALSADCGGHCWGCMSEIEAEAMGFDVEVYRRDHDRIWAYAAARAMVEQPAELLPPSKSGDRPWWKFWG